MVKQTSHKGGQGLRRLHLVRSPVHCRRRQIFRRAITVFHTSKNKSRLTQLMLVQMRNDFGRPPGVSQNKGMQVSSQRSFDRRNQLMRDIELCREGAAKFKFLVL